MEKKNFLGSFRRNADGSWTCLEPVTLNRPAGRIQFTPDSTFPPGKLFMGVDVARLLDDEAARGNQPGTSQK